MVLNQIMLSGGMGCRDSPENAGIISLHPLVATGASNEARIPLRISKPASGGTHQAVKTTQAADDPSRKPRQDSFVGR
jgi:hypothetical protein